MSEYVGDVSKRGTACHQTVKPVLAMYIAIKRLLKVCLLGTLLLEAATGGAQTFSVLKSFSATSTSSPYTNTDGANPQSLLLLSGNTIFGTANRGGAGGSGTIFKISNDGSGFNILKNYSGTGGDVGYPHGGLTLSGSVLFGTTEGGGSFGLGTIFKLNTNGTGYVILKSFTYSDGENLVCPS